MQFGYAAGDIPHLVDPAAWATLCGQRAQFVPVVQPPFAPPDLCPACTGKAEPAVASADAEPAAPRARVRVVECPDCGGKVEKSADRVEPHKQWRVGKHGPYVSNQPCPVGR